MLIRGKYVITDPRLPDAILENGAVCTRGDRIIAVGQFADLARRYPEEQQLGSGEDLLLPGLVNAHDHGRAPSSLQLGVADDRVEMWLPALMGQRAIDPYLSTAYAVIQQIESGVTTLLHSHYDPNLAQDERALPATIQAYEHAGIHAVVALGILDQSPISAHFDRLMPSLPQALQAEVANFLGGRPTLPPEAFFSIFRTWFQQYKEDSTVSFILGPVSAHWCSQSLLARVRREAETLQVPIQTHLLETRYQRDQAVQKHGVSAVSWLHETGFLSPLLSCVHCVWVTAKDIALLAQHGTSVVYNPGSNLRLHSGIAPVNLMIENGVNVALGTDSLGLNDDGDLLQEMRLGAYLQRVSSTGGNAPTALQMLAMATTNGAQALGMETGTGTLQPGKRADLILVATDRLWAPVADPELHIVDALLSRAKAQDVHTVIAGGRLIMRDRNILTLDKEAIVGELQAQLKHARSGNESKLLTLSRQLAPYARKQLEQDGSLLPTATQPDTR